MDGGFLTIAAINKEGDNEKNNYRSNVINLYQSWVNRTCSHRNL